MHLQQLILINFRNYSDAELEFSEGINCIVGKNGVGKTNLLDAIYYLSFCKSAFNPIDSQNIKQEEPFFSITGKYTLKKKKEAVHCGMKRNQKKIFRRNKKEYKRLADHIGMFPLVMVSPADSAIITEGSDIRRKFIDGVISQYNKPFLDDLLNYYKALAQRNALLRSFRERGGFDKGNLEVWNEQMIHLGNNIYKERKQFLEKFTPVFQQHYEHISGGKEKVGLEYRSQLHDEDFSALLDRALENDRRMQHSTAGIHKDDLVFKTGNFPVKKFASQGQQKSYLIALKLAQFDFIREIKKLTPLLLFDDIFDKLDAERVGALMELAGSGNFGQVFITHTSEEGITMILEQAGQKFKMFRIEDGVVR